MAKAKRVYHWKHGWIPISPEAKAFVAGRGPRPGTVGDVATKDRAALAKKMLLSEIDKIDTASFPKATGKIADLPRIRTGQEHSLADDISVSNPRFGQTDAYTKNCMHCVNAVELRRRGYDVIATPLPDDLDLWQGRSVSSAMKAWRTPPGSPVPYRLPTQATGKGVDNLVENVWPEGARGWVVVHWKKTGTSHIFAVEKVDGKAVYSDPQNGRLDAKSYLSEDRAQRMVQVVRVDDLEPTDAVTEFVQAPEAKDRITMLKLKEAASKPAVTEKKPVDLTYFNKVLAAMGNAATTEKKVAGP